MRNKTNSVHRKKSLKLGGRPADIFYEIIEACGLLLTVGYHPVAILRYGLDGIRRMDSARERAYRRQEIERLRKKKLLTIQKVGEEYHVALTNRGLREAFRLQVLRAKPMPDGCVCMVVFDIPEQEKKLRATLRTFLRYADFAPLQRSVWTSSHDAWEPLAKLFDVNRTSKWVSVFVARKMDLRK